MNKCDTDMVNAMGVIRTLCPTYNNCLDCPMYNNCYKDKFSPAYWDILKETENE